MLTTFDLDFIPIVVDFWPYEWMWCQDVCWLNDYWWI